VHFTKNYWGNQINESEKQRACSKHKRGVKCISAGKPEVKSHPEDLDTDGRIKLKRMLKKWGLSMTIGFIRLRIGSGTWLL
jgi:hypothetical protein